MSSFQQAFETPSTSFGLSLRPVEGKLLGGPPVVTRPGCIPFL
jgi:hypothetical protein